MLIFYTKMDYILLTAPPLKASIHENVELLLISLENLTAYCLVTEENCSVRFLVISTHLESWTEVSEIAYKSSFALECGTSWLRFIVL